MTAAQNQPLHTTETHTTSKEGKSKPKVIIVGAGPGGLSAAMLLGQAGYHVQIYEKKPYIGGRTSSVHLEDYTFDLGPTFFMMPYILEEIFEATGRKLSDYVTLKDIDPMYQLVFKDKKFWPTRDQQKMYDQIKAVFPGNEDGYLTYLKKEKKRFERLVPCLQIPYENVFSLFKPQFLKSLPYLDAHVSLHDVLSRYFKHEDLKIAFTFQAKYLGMSPWTCPGTFSILSYIEHGGGIYHVMGGLNQLTKAMAKVVEEQGGEIFLDTGVSELLVENGKTYGVLLEDGTHQRSSQVVVNADFSAFMSKHVKESNRPKYKDRTLKEKRYSCSTFMMYLGVDKVYDLPHHTIVFADDYKRNVREIAEDKVISPDPSIYIQHASLTDPQLAPAGHSTLYILVPVPNNSSNIDWEQAKKSYREKVYSVLKHKMGMGDLKEHVVVEKVIAPSDWEAEYDVYNGAVFNLSHDVKQMLMFRPHNRFEDIEGCYLVGGGTHPGSGLPTIIESGRITAQLLMSDTQKTSTV